MNCQNNRYSIIIFLTTMIIMLYPFMVPAETVKTTLGFKTNYSSGVSDTNIAYKPYGKIGYDISFLNIEVTGTYIIHQQITDGMGNFTEINTGQGQIKALLSLGDIMDFGGGYSLVKGQNSYNTTMYMLNGSLYIGDVTIDLDYTREDKSYFYNSDVEIINQTFIGSLSYDFNDDIGYEFEYHYNPPTITSTSRGHGGPSGGGYKGMNPYIRSDLAGKSFVSHSLSASLSYSFLQNILEVLYMTLSDCIR